jgi:hypothetical protein
MEDDPSKALAFVRHIEEHFKHHPFKGSEVVMCKICDKTIDEIWEETEEENEILERAEAIRRKRAFG